METIHKYKDPEIEITYSGKALEELPEYAEITKEVAECEAIVEGIIDQFVEIDASIKEMRKRFSNTANSLFDSVIIL